MSNRYFFDKRDWKRRFTKYGIIFAISFLPIVFFNILCSKYLSKQWLVIFLDSVILLVFVAIGNSIAEKIFEKKDKRLEKIQKEREELKARKKKIMEDSYQKIRLEKERKKKEKLEGNEIVEVAEVPVKQSDTKTTNTPKTKSTGKKSKVTSNKNPINKTDTKVVDVIEEKVNVGTVSIDPGADVVEITTKSKTTNTAKINNTTKKTNNKIKGNSK